MDRLPPTRVTVAAALERRWEALATSLYQWDLGPAGRDLKKMSRGTAPESALYHHGEAAVILVGDQLHVLPYVESGPINLYGFSRKIRPVPPGGVPLPPGIPSECDVDDVVIIREDPCVRVDLLYLAKISAEMAEIAVTSEIAAILVRQPYIFAVPEGRRLDAQNFWLAIREGSPRLVIDQAALGLVPTVLQTGARIDPAVWEVWDRWGCLALEHLGIPCVPLTKRAQQSVSEVDQAGDQIALVRHRRLAARRAAAEEIRERWGIDVTVESVLDTAVATGDEDGRLLGEDPAPGDDDSE